MEYIVKIFMTYLSLTCVLSGNFVYAQSSDEVKYAKAHEDCILYKTSEMNNDYDSVYFEVPETYFVTILNIVEKDVCYMVQYDRYVGYVDAKSVSLVNFSPIVKTLSNISFDIKNNSGTQIWSAPTTQSDIYTTLSAGTKNINYIASVSGSIPDGGKSDVWYYISYTPNINSTNFYEGYIYSENTINLSNIVANLEVDSEIILDDFKNEKIFFISSTIKTIIVAIMVIPIILFLTIILYKITKKFKKTTNYTKNTDSNNDLKLSEKSIDSKNGFVSKFKEMFKLNSHNLDKNFVDLNDDELLWNYNLDF